MSSYRLHIDIPMPLSEHDAAVLSQKIISSLSSGEGLAILQENGIEQVNYRLGHDDDRQKSNYLLKNENGHVANKKNRILVREGLTAAE
jgi:hypothetical protein